MLRQWFGYRIIHCHGRHEGPSVLFYTLHPKEILRPPLEQEIVLGAEEPLSDYFAGRGLKSSAKPLPAGSNLAMTKKWWWLVLEFFVSLAPRAWLGQRPRKSSSTRKNCAPDALGRSIGPYKSTPHRPSRQMDSPSISKTLPPSVLDRELMMDPASTPPRARHSGVVQCMRRVTKTLCRHYIPMKTRVDVPARGLVIFFKAQTTCCRTQSTLKKDLRRRFSTTNADEFRCAACCPVYSSTFVNPR